MASTVSAADLAALEGLLNEFFATQTSNERKREIEQVLTHFGEQTNSWHLCLGFLVANKDNHFVSMFVLTTLETIIRRKWIGMPGNEKVSWHFRKIFSFSIYTQFLGHERASACSWPLKMVFVCCCCFVL